MVHTATTLLSTLKMDASDSSETFLTVYQTVHHIVQDSNIIAAALGAQNISQFI
jgi:hypothetical protein